MVAKVRGDFSRPDRRLSEAMASEGGETERLFQAILDTSESIIFAKDREGVYILANPAFARLLDRPLEEIIGKRDHEIFSKGEAARLREIDAKVLSGEPAHTEDTLTVNEVKRVFATTKLPLKDKTGRIVGLCGFAQEVTEEKGLIESLRQSEHLLRSIFDSVQDGISVLNPDLTVRYVNPKMKEWYAENLPLEGKKCFACYHNRSEPCDPCPSLRSLRSGMVERNVVPGLPGSAVEWIELFSYPMKDADSGELTGVVEFVRDITEKVRDERQIVHLNTVLRAIRAVNQLITQESDRDRLLQRACELLIETRGYRSAWIALLDRDGALSAFYHAGLGDNAPSMEKMLKKGELPECARRALARPGVAMIEDPASDCGGCPLLEISPEYRGMTTRLEYKGKGYGLISVGVPSWYAGIQEEHELLHELAGDISLALNSLEAQEALRESEAHYRSIVENSHAGVLVVDEAYRFVYVNDQLCRILDREREEIIGHDFREFLDRESRDLVADRYRRRQAGEEVPPRYEFNVMRKDGEKRRVEISSTVIRNPRGQVRTVAQILDITERTHLQQRLDAIDELTRTLILLRDKNAIIRHAIDAAKSLLGMADCSAYLIDEKTEKLLVAGYTKEVPVRFHEMDLFSKEGIIPAVARRGRSETHSELCVPIKVGDKVFGTLNAESSKIDGFGPAERQLLTTLADSTAVALENLRLNAETVALKEFNERIVTTLNEGILLEDASGTIIYVNPAGAKMLGYSSEELVGKKWTFLVPEEERAAIEARISKRRPGVNDRYQTTLLTKDGGRLPVILSVSPLFEDGEYTGTASAFTDITKRVNAENALVESFAKARQTLDGIVEALEGAIDLRDPYTAGHQMRVAQLSVAIGEEMNLPEEKIDALRYAALVHDIGKLSVPAEILARPGKLSDTEFKIIKAHPGQAHSILKGIDFPWPVDEIVLQHHERLDGSGYPNGLKEGEIMLEARILAVADVVEAMASHRPYRPAHGIKAALIEIVRNKGKLYDPEVVDACLSVFEKGFDFKARN